MSDNINDLFKNVKKMVDSGNIPNDIQQMMNNLQQSSNNNSTNNNDLNNILSQLSPDMINNLSNMLNNNNNNNQNSQSTNNSSNFNLDMNTIMKVKTIMDNMNNKNDPRANLLHSLKPYLRDSKKEKVDQYVNLLNISKIADVMNPKGNKENKNE